MSDSTGPGGPGAARRPRRIKVTRDGPYIVTGGVPMVEQKIVLGRDGEPECWEPGRTFPARAVLSLCRCGASRTKPFCDGSHVAIHFDGTETGTRDPYLAHVDRTTGPALEVTWSEEICAVARFCHRGEDAWTYTEKSNDPAARRIAVEECCACPSGSLVAYEKSGRAIEPELEPSLGIVENPAAGFSGPIWVRGGIPVESVDGFTYEVRNRMTLCRCGRSARKPFCDGSHIAAKFDSSK